MKRSILVPPLLVVFAGVFQSSAQTVYDWISSSTGGNWSDTLQWTPSGSPGALDTANLTNAAADRTILYDSAASGTLSSLNIVQTGAAQNILDVQRSMSIANALTLGASGGGLSLLRISPGASSIAITAPSLAINSGGQFEMRAGSSNSAVPVFNGDIFLNSGGILTITRGPSSASTYGGATINGAVTVAAGSVFNLFPSGSGSSTDNRMNINGNLTITGGSNIISGNTLNLFGAVNSISGVATPGSGTVALLANSDQSLSGTASLSAVAMRSTGSSTKLIGNNGGATMSVGTLQFGQGTSGATTTMRLTSNVSGRSNFGAMPQLSAAGNANGGRYAIDVNGYTLDISTVSGSNPVFTAQGSGGNPNAQWTLTNTSATTGTIRAGSFNLAGANLAASNVGPNVVLHATGGGSSPANANNLGGPSGTVDATSTFLYAPASNITSTLTSNRAIGALTVRAGILRIVTTGLQAAADVTVADTASVATLDLGGQSLTLSGSASLRGNGIVTDSLGSGTVSFALGATGGLSAGVNGVGTLTLAGTLGGLDLSNAGGSTFDFAGLSSFDVLDLASHNIVYGGALSLNFLSGYTPNLGDSFNIFQNVSGQTGGFSSITSNTGYGFSFDEATGMLSVVAVPEPGALALLFGAAFYSLAAGRLRRGVCRGTEC